MKITIESPEEAEQLRAALVSHETTLRLLVNRAGRHAKPETILAYEVASALRRKIVGRAKS